MQPRKWWIGFVPLAVVFLLAMWRSSAPVEADLSAKATAELQRSGLGWAKAMLAGRDAVVEGVAPEPGMQAMARDAAERAWGVRRVTDRMTVLPEQKPYVVTVVREGTRFTLTGSVPNDEARAAAVAAAKAAVPNAEVVDQRTLARGAPAGYAAGLGHGVAQIGRLLGGTAGLSDGALSVSGTAGDFAAFDAVTAALAGLPAGVALGKAEIVPPRISPFEVTVNKTVNALALAGVIPAESARAGLLAAARTAAGTVGVTDGLRVASGAPAGVDFGAATAFVLAQVQRLATGSAKLTDTALSISGAASDFAGFDAVTAALKTLPAGVRLASADIRPPRVTPFSLEAQKTAAGITLGGVIPAESARAGIVAAARAAAGSGTVLDNLRVADGAPAGVDIPAAAGFALGQLARLTGGTARLNDGSLSLAGAAPTVQAYEAVTGALRSASLPGGARVGTVEVTGPTQSPYTWSARRDATGLTLAGYIPAESLRAGIVAQARSLFPNVNVVDQLQLALGAPNGFADGVKAALTQLARLASGSATLTNTALNVTGEAAQAAAAEQLRGALASALPPGFTGQANVTVKAPPPPPPAPPPAPQPSGIIVPSLPPVVLSAVARQCQDRFSQMLASEKIQFASGSADIQEASNALLRALAEEAKRCPAARIDVEGHTDSDGAPDANRLLSERRATAVVVRMVDFGIERHRLVPRGFGQTRPLAANDTPENKARNRRIEFVVSE